MSEGMGSNTDSLNLRHTLPYVSCYAVRTRKHTYIFFRESVDWLEAGGEDAKHTYSPANIPVLPHDKYH
jgi:hypothetical protein